VVKESARKSAVVALLVLALLWGYNWVQMKVAVQYASPFTFAALRITLGGLCLLAALAWLRKPILPKEFWGTFWIGLLQSAGVYGFASWALVSGGAGKTAVLVYTMPFWTLLFAWMFLQERIRGFQWLAIGLSIAGLLFILEPLHPKGTIASQALAILAGVSWAGGAVVNKKLRQRVELDLLSLTTWQTLFGAIPLVLVALFVPAEPIEWSGAFVFALAYNVIPGTAIAMLLWLYILNRLPAGAAGLGTLLNPVVGVLAAWTQLGERPGLAETVGMVLIAIALMLNSVQVLKPQPPVRRS